MSTSRGQSKTRDTATIEVLIPSPFNGVILGALSSAAIENNQFAIDALETIRRVKAGEPVGLIYVHRLNDFMRMHCDMGQQRA